MDKNEIELLLDVLDLYKDICRSVGAENKLDSTNIVDTLLRLKSGEYVIRENRDY